MMGDTRYATPQPRQNGDAVAAVEAVAAVVRAHRYTYASEELLQAGIAASLEAAGIPVEREVRLERGRVDMLAGGVAVEVKVASTVTTVIRQLRRYAASPRVDGLVLVTSRVRHVRAPADLNGKPVRVVTLAEQAL